MVNQILIFMGLGHNDRCYNKLFSFAHLTVINWVNVVQCLYHDLKACEKFNIKNNALKYGLTQQENNALKYGLTQQGEHSQLISSMFKLIEYLLKVGTNVWMDLEPFDGKRIIIN